MRSNLHSLSATLLLALLAGSPAVAGVANYAGSIWSDSKKVAFKKAPALETVVALASDVELSEETLLHLNCNLQAIKDDQNLAPGAKGRYESRIEVLDAATGTLEVFEAGSGTFQTGPTGGAGIGFDIPASLFGDALSSDDVLVQIRTRVRFTSKKGSYLDLYCSLFER
jgi:hypothetical protein